MILETQRLRLREMNQDDFQALYRVIGDPENMVHYPAPYDREGTQRWLSWCLDCYARYGFGLWAVCLKDTGEMIGDCGLSLQKISGETLPEIGFHIRRDCQRRGYAKEAARAVRDWAFRNTDHPALYSYCKNTNVPSFRTAEAIGMRFASEYPDQISGKMRVSVITREDWLKEIQTEYQYLSLLERPELLESAAAWFHEKWGVPKEAYHACMTAYLDRETEYGWYLCLAGNRIAGGLGVIANDFHDRKDLTPNVCAVYTEKDCRGHGIAGRLLDLAVEDMRAKGITPLYLVTDHTGFYERYGWEFLCMAHEDDGGEETRVYIHR